MKSSLFYSILLVCLVSSAVALEQKDCRCRVQAGRRIIGGGLTRPWPWHLSLGKKINKTNGLSPLEVDKINRHHCGAIILNEQWSLTSANCVYDSNRKAPVKPEWIDLGYNSNDLLDIVDRNKLVEVDQIVLHPDFNSTKLEANLALLKLKTPLKFNDSVQPACLELDHPRQIYAEQLVGFGFGVTDVIYDSRNVVYRFGNLSRFLKESPLQDKSGDLDICYDKNLDETICLAGSGKLCRGDEGSPLQKHANGKATVVGLASWFEEVYVTIGGGFGSDHAWKPCDGNTVHTHLAAPRFINWIKKTVDQICH